MPNTASVSQQRPMNCRFDDILTFIRVVESGSVTAAATLLNVSKSVISKRVSDLESALRVSSVIAHAWCAAAPTMRQITACRKAWPIWSGTPASIIRTFAPAIFGSSKVKPAAKDHYPS